jgi:SAM-dependent methyltransferase
MSEGEGQTLTALTSDIRHLSSESDYQAFYRSKLGHAAQDVLRAHVGEMWPALKGERVMPLGCGALLLGMPAVSARMAGTDEEMFSCLIDSRNKPVPDTSADRVLTLHTDVTYSDIEHLVREIWRVLKGEGRLLMIVPRKNGAWARSPDTPFGKEPAYSASQIKKLLNDAGFFVEHIGRALYAPPCSMSENLFLARKIERIAPWLCFCRGGGVLLIDAQKRVCGCASLRARNRRRRADPLVPLAWPVSGRVQG